MPKNDIIKKMSAVTFLTEIITVMICFGIMILNRDPEADLPTFLVIILSIQGLITSILSAMLVKEQMKYVRKSFMYYFETWIRWDTYCMLSVLLPVIGLLYDTCGKEIFQPCSLKKVFYKFKYPFLHLKMEVNPRYNFISKDDPDYVLEAGSTKAAFYLVHGLFIFTWYCIVTGAWIWYYIIYHVIWICKCLKTRPFSEIANIFRDLKSDIVSFIHKENSSLHPKNSVPDEKTEREQDMKIYQSDSFETGGNIGQLHTYAFLEKAQEKPVIEKETNIASEKISIAENEQNTENYQSENLESGVNINKLKSGYPEKSKEKNKNTERQPETIALKRSIVVLYFIIIVLALIIIIGIIFVFQHFGNNNTPVDLSASVFGRSENNNFGITKAENINPTTNSTTESPSILVTEPPKPKITQLPVIEPTEKIEVYSCYATGEIDGRGVSGFTTSYVVNHGEKTTVYDTLGDGWHVTAYNYCYSYDIVWYELYDTYDGDYYGWVDENYLNFYDADTYEEVEVYSCYSQGEINGRGVSGFTTSYVVNHGEKTTVYDTLGDGWHVTACNYCYSYDIVWYELYDTNNGEYYGWVDENFLKFYYGD